MSKNPQYWNEAQPVPDQNLYTFELQVMVDGQSVAVIVVKAHDVQTAHELAARAIKVEPAERPIPYILLNKETMPA
jgi:hypothetical protein